MGTRFSHRNVEEHEHSKHSNHFGNFLPPSLWALVSLATAGGHSDSLVQKKKLELKDSEGQPCPGAPELKTQAPPVASVWIPVHWAPMPACCYSEGKVVGHDDLCYKNTQKAPVLFIQCLLCARYCAERVSP